MKARITSKSEIRLDLNQDVMFDILTDNDQTVLTSQTMAGPPSQLANMIKEKLLAYQVEYDVSQQLEIGAEIS